MTQDNGVRAQVVELLTDLSSGYSTASREKIVDRYADKILALFSRELLGMVLSEEEIAEIIEIEFNRFNEIVPNWCKLFEGDRELNVRDLKPNLVKAIMKRINK